MDIEHEARGHERVRRFHLTNTHLESAFGSDWFGKKAEDFARFFGTPTFLVAQTILVGLWILVNAVGWTQFDVYPFILLNLAFSTQAAYAAPLILLAQTRQADRDKAATLADAQHREELHQISEQRQEQMREQAGMLIEMLKQNTVLTERVEALLKQNTELTQTVRTLVERIDAMTCEVHARVTPAAGG
ncbi:MAG TPA: DUF1003 domain-containing protein [Roseiarcus sp.]|jgi:uncharacterized membrane protein